MRRRSGYVNILVDLIIILLFLFVCEYIQLKHIYGLIKDHASGSLVVTEAGGIVTDSNGKALDFSVGRTLKNNIGIVTCHPNIHGEVVKAAKEVLKKKMCA